jgi:hypothetical protein
VCGVATLTRLDTASSTLLANADRWADRSVFSRDLIDLAMMQPTPSILDEAVAKTGRAYGDSTVRSLHSAIAYLRDDPSRLDECMSALGMGDTPKALLWQRITVLAEHLTRDR